MLSKIELKLGKKTITLTQKQFEELKQDMRNLDKDHYYYWHNYQWPRWYYAAPQPIFCNVISTTTLTGNIAGGQVSTYTANNCIAASEDYLLTANLNQLDSKDQQDPPAFNGTVLSAS